MNNKFLNKKSIPTSLDILNLFFDEEDMNKYMESTQKDKEADLIEDDSEMSSLILEELNELGEAINSEVHEGTEWRVTRLTWNAKIGPIYRITVEKIKMRGVDYNPFSKINPFNDSDFITEISHKELMDMAIEEEDFDEAARLRDWNVGLTKLLKDLKPKIIKAIEDESLEDLDECSRILNSYRNSL